MAKANWERKPLTKRGKRGVSGRAVCVWMSAEGHTGFQLHYLFIKGPCCGPSALVKLV